MLERSACGDGRQSPLQENWEYLVPALLHDAAAAADAETTSLIEESERTSEVVNRNLSVRMMTEPAGVDDLIVY